MAQLRQVFAVTGKTIYNWFVAWESDKFVGLYDRGGRGRKPTFSPDQQQQIREWAKESPNQLKQVLQKIQAAWGITVSKDTLKRVLKRLAMSWRRARRVVARQPDAAEFQQQQQLEVLKRRAERGEIDLRYLDESGFSLISAIPYAWQEAGTVLTVAAQQSARLNVVGVMNRDNELEAYLFEESITSAVIIAGIDAWAQTCPRPTVIVMDQASIHTSNALQEKLPEWRQQQIEIFELPAYSPQLNLIEILGRFMKYEWIELSAYESWESLVQYVEKVIQGFGEDYVINFA
jgi:transposase